MVTCIKNFYVRLNEETGGSRQLRKYVNFHGTYVSTQATQYIDCRRHKKLFT